MKNIIIIFFIALLISNTCTAISINKDSIECTDKVYEKNIKTVRIFANDDELSYPVIDLHSDNFLLFSFDRIEPEKQYYYYTIIHCTHDWKPSNIMFFDYAEGFEENQITSYQQSHSTLVPYTHYELEIPNYDISLKYSGNYLLIVYTKNSEQDEIVCTKRFMIYENLVEVEGRIGASADNMYRTTSQKIDFRINKRNYEIYDPFSELKIVILQNYQWNNAYLNLEPSFIDNNTFRYEWVEKPIFGGSNEYRVFNIINLKFPGENVENIKFKNPYYYIDIMEDKSRLFSKYLNYTDFNGLYAIRTDRFANKDFPEVQADYAIVKFRLNYNIPINNVDIYLYGELTNYELTDDYKLLYNLETRCYEKLLLLKQGYYNYRYITVSKDEKRMVDHGFFEGNYFDTKNDYQLFIYHKSPQKSYDQLINYTVFNSFNN
jgi:hypothetical protein